MVGQSIKCPSCGNYFYDTEEKCKNCGATNPNYQKAVSENDESLKDDEKSFDQKMEEIRNTQIAQNKYSSGNPYTGK